mmetsp:Transcript_54884/g.128307  ORF Transcript_54884/g.128307 Transcript_54884/m.128307 type:complete len:221 (-) Transcript_54884:534-1196(-)
MALFFFSWRVSSIGESLMTMSSTRMLRSTRETSGPAYCRITSLPSVSISQRCSFTCGTSSKCTYTNGSTLDTPSSSEPTTTACPLTTASSRTCISPNPASTSIASTSPCPSAWAANTNVCRESEPRSEELTEKRRKKLASLRIRRSSMKTYVSESFALMLSKYLSTPTSPTFSISVIMNALLSAGAMLAMTGNDVCGSNMLSICARPTEAWTDVFLGPAV